MARTHCITERIVTPASFSENGAVLTPAAVSFVSHHVPFTAEEAAAADAAAIPTPAGLLAYAADKRRALANASTSVNLGSRTIPVWTDAESRGAITGLVVASQIVANLTAPWKGSDGKFYDLNAAEMVALALGMMTYVQSCFAKEAAVTVLITGGSIITLAAVDTAFVG